MPVSITELAQAAQRVKNHSDKSVGWPLAAIKAIEGKGIRHKADVARLKRDVLEHLKTEGVIRSSARGKQPRLHPASKS